ncbi:MAG: pyridoxamine 5'-phosphate oxidase family protein [Oxalobacter sp.]|jgi:nitroimidazol reductase NimA-like FMN-containing flavoprotein (pyridoxamine 5'-phosphate oxidase superfamily)|nr:pyridoxamine 5'-phosphate oxidase family protein [Oxalobacter sp.]MBR6000362.1 pyridoxamine 5'-phosphate oxidase family protein [Oxalobacter sp.]
MEFVSHTLRRKDRIMIDADALRLLREAEFGVLSMVSDNGAYGIPITYAWDGSSTLYFHGAHVGRKIDCLQKNPHVSFCIVGKTRVLRKEASVAYESLILEGTVKLNLSNEEKRHGLGLIVNRFSDGNQPGVGHMDERMLDRVNVWKMDVLTISGKRRPDPDAS